MQTTSKYLRQYFNYNAAFNITWSINQTRDQLIFKKFRGSDARKHRWIEPKNSSWKSAFSLSPNICCPKGWRALPFILSQAKHQGRKLICNDNSKILTFPNQERGMIGLLYSWHWVLSIFFFGVLPGIKGNNCFLLCKVYFSYANWITIWCLASLLTNDRS